ncbi:hypothetical protein glysoja_031155 [Glycine soja]|uniref:Uncharacterized protein n=1 Tax=Glycine soja TaxID=3848 RepID=A0A0B2SPL8_GLYSO|nr:hypothetical protein glysoja_031155 [Glycine soja]
MNPQIRTLVAIAFVVAGSHAGDEALVVGSRDNCHWKPSELKPNVSLSGVKVVTDSVVVSDDGDIP